MLLKFSSILLGSPDQLLNELFGVEIWLGVVIRRKPGDDEISAQRVTAKAEHRRFETSKLHQSAKPVLKKILKRGGSQTEMLEALAVFYSYQIGHRDG